MLMLYLFKVEVFDFGLNYAYSSDCVVIADTNEDRVRLVHRQFGGLNKSVVKHSVLLGARALTLTEIHLLETTSITADRMWLVTRLPSLRVNPYVRSLPRLHDKGEMYECLERAPERYDTSPLMEEQYRHSSRFAGCGRVATTLSAAA